MYRSEYKYYLSTRILDDLRKDILPYLNYDSHLPEDGRKEYTVRSIYLDSHSMECYHEKLSGLERRAKFRIRAYNIPEDNSLCFLEIKRKHGDFIAKDRAPLLIRDIEAFFSSNNFSLLQHSGKNREAAELAAKNFLFHYYSKNLKPIVIINYDREPFECKFGTGVRITFDKNIRSHPTSSLSQLSIDENMLYPLNDVFVLEVKFYNNLPLWIPDILRKYNINRASASKYTMSIDRVSERYYNFGLNYV